MVELDLTAGIRIMLQRTFKLKTICGKCGKEITYKLLPFSEKNPLGCDYTLKCRCGLEKFSYHKADAFHKNAFFLRIFISKNQYIKNYNKLSELERIGFKKKVLDNGRKTAFEK